MMEWMPKLKAKTPVKAKNPMKAKTPLKAKNPMKAKTPMKAKKCIMKAKKCMKDGGMGHEGMKASKLPFIIVASVKSTSMSLTFIMSTSIKLAEATSHRAGHKQVLRWPMGNNRPAVG